ncbi:unnamed protein product [Clavelina lepadiformis]|uniref:NAD-dependent epimerase/dehydratase domain-containing protein n=1 Tax=Clavelina lepadiformis TaxID=159417 RepID=A0ABP0GHQ6_CLALP
MKNLAKLLWEALPRYPGQAVSRNNIKFQHKSPSMTFQVRHQSAVTGKRIIITGGLGQIGQRLAAHLRAKYGQESVLLTDVKKPTKEVLKDGPYEYADILDYNQLKRLVVNHGADWLIHFSALLSAVGEQNVPLAVKVNINGLHNILNIANDFGLRLFVPSTIGAFGVDSPKNPTPDFCIQRPKTIYGVAKVHAELMGEYYKERFGLDFRSLRYPGIISADLQLGGGTTDYAVMMFYHALTSGHFTCGLRPDTRMPMMHIDDCITSTLKFMETPEEKLKQRVYNISAMSFTPQEISDEIKKYIPEFQVTYKGNPLLQGIADSWPDVFEDVNARRDWGHYHHYDITRLAEFMMDNFKQQLDLDSSHQRVLS